MVRKSINLVTTGEVEIGGEIKPIGTTIGEASLSPWAPTDAVNAAMEAGRVMLREVNRPTRRRSRGGNEGQE